MKQLPLIYLLILTLTACNNGHSKKSASDKTDALPTAASKTNTQTADAKTAKMQGVLIIYSDSMQTDFNSLMVTNPDKTAFAKIASVNGIEPYSTPLKGNILAYDPDHYVIHFEAGSISDSMYSVKVGAEVKIIAKSKYTAYLSWPEYLKKFSCSAELNNPLRQTAADDAQAIMPLNYKELSFNCIDVKGDWVKVNCNAEYVGSPKGKTLTGWLRWRKNGRVILKQQHSC